MMNTPSKEALHFGRGIRKLRNQCGLKQKQLAHAAGTNVTTVSLIENGHTNTTIDLLSKIANALGTNLAGLHAAGTTSLRHSDQAIKDIFGKNVKNRRLELGLSRKEAGNPLGILPQYFATTENCRRLPSITNMIRLAEALDCSTFTLLKGIGNADAYDGIIKPKETNRSAREIVDFLKQERIKRKLPIVKLAKSAGISHTQLNFIENYHHEPVLSSVIALSDALQINLHNIFQK